MERKSNVRWYFCFVGIVLCLVLQACEEDDWGDQAAAFVDNEIRGISESYVRNDLTEVWSQGIVKAEMDFTVQEKLLEAEIAGASAPKSDDLATLNAPKLLERFNASDGTLAELTDASIRLEKLKTEISVLDKACDDPVLFYSRGLGNLGVTGPVAAIGPKLSSEDAEITISASYGTGGSDSSNILTAIAQLGTSIFDAGQAAQQNARLDAAVQRIPQRAVQPTEAFEISKMICKQQFMPEGHLVEIYMAIRSGVGDLSIALDEKRQTALLTRDLIASYLRPIEIKAFLDDTGVTALLTDAQKAMVNGQLGVEVEANLGAVVSLATKMQQTKGCIDRMAMGEDFEDATIELHAQLKVLRDKSTDESVTKRMDHAIKTLENLTKAMPAMYNGISREACS